MVIAEGVLESRKDYPVVTLTDGTRVLAGLGHLNLSKFMLRYVRVRRAYRLR